MIEQVVSLVQTSSQREKANDDLSLASLIALLNIVDELSTKSKEKVEIPTYLSLIAHLFDRIPEIH